MPRMDAPALVTLAEQIATAAHQGQWRRDGITPYIEHPRAVVSRVGNDAQTQAVAWLHDVIEDTDHTADSLQSAGIPAPVIADVLLLTKTPGQDYDTYLQRLTTSPRATCVKIADMLTNLADNPTPKQIRKYAQGLLYLTKGG